jgi:hypothetical protein
VIEPAGNFRRLRVNVSALDPKMFFQLKVVLLN